MYTFTGDNGLDNHVNAYDESTMLVMNMMKMPTQTLPRFGKASGNINGHGVKPQL